MKNIHVFTVLIISTSPLVIADEAAPKADSRSTLFERMFGSNARPPKVVPMVAGEGGRLASEETWELHRRGHLPPGEILTTAQAALLPPGSYLGKPTYLTGSFAVTAAGPKRVVLRPVSASPSIRVVVEYATAGVPAMEGTSMVVEPAAGLLIHRVMKSVDDSVTIYTKDVTQP